MRWRPKGAPFFFAFWRNITIKLPIIAVAMHALARILSPGSVQSTPTLVEAARRALPVSYEEVRATLTGIKRTDDVLTQSKMLRLEAVLARLRESNNDDSGDEAIQIRDRLQAVTTHISRMGRTSEDQEIADMLLRLSDAELYLLKESQQKASERRSLAKKAIKLDFDDEEDPLDNVCQGFKRRITSATGEPWTVSYYRGFDRNLLAVLRRRKSTTGIMIAQNEATCVGRKGLVRMVGAGDTNVPTTQLLLTRSGLTLLLETHFHKDTEGFLQNPKPRNVIDGDNAMTYTAIAGHRAPRAEIPVSLIEGALGMVIPETLTPT